MKCLQTTSMTRVHDCLGLYIKVHFTGGETGIIFSTVQVRETKSKATPQSALSESSKVPLSTINDLSPCPSPLISVVGVRTRRGGEHASSGAQEGTFATPTCRRKHVGTYGLSTVLADYQRCQSIVHGPVGQSIKQLLPFFPRQRSLRTVHDDLCSVLQQ